MHFLGKNLRVFGKNVLVLGENGLVLAGILPFLFNFKRVFVRFCFSVREKSFTWKKVLPINIFLSIISSLLKTDVAHNQETRDRSNEAAAFFVFCIAMKRSSRGLVFSRETVF
ncbi:MAG: hypothetical protein M3384_09620 [Acidobacteriota bacterium]|nr:hypothetical protein [Acidobacteriota bacterium]